MKLTARSIAMAWLSALVLLVGILIAIGAFGQRRVDGRFTGVDTVFLGTSLFRHALPDLGQITPLPQVDAEKSLRIGLNNGSERQILDMATAAVASGVGKVFIEINPLVSRFATDRAGCGVRNSLQHQLGNLKIFTDAILLGRDIYWPGAEPANKDKTRSINPETTAKYYPLKFVGPCHVGAWQRLFTTSKGTRFVLVMMPRDGVAKQLIGADDMATFERRARAFSAQFDIPLFVPESAGDWGEELFLDQAHLSGRGADRFGKELAAWWRVQK